MMHQNKNAACAAKRIRVAAFDEPLRIGADAKRLESEGFRAKPPSPRTERSTPRHARAGNVESATDVGHADATDASKQISLRGNWTSLGNEILAAAWKLAREELRHQPSPADTTPEASA